MFEPLSKEFLLNRGFCCKNGCLNCPYEQENNMKQTKFEEWYSETWGSKSEDTDESNKAFYAWQACKEEILKILDKCSFPDLPLEIEEEIKNL